MNRKFDYFILALALLLMPRVMGAESQQAIGRSCCGAYVELRAASTCPGCASSDSNCAQCCSQQAHTVVFVLSETKNFIHPVIAFTGEVVSIEFVGRSEVPLLPPPRTFS